MTWHSLTLVGLDSIPGQGNKIHKPRGMAKKKKKKKKISAPNGTPKSFHIVFIVFMLCFQLYESVVDYTEICQVKLKNECAMYFRIHHTYFLLDLISELRAIIKL